MITNGKNRPNDGTIVIRDGRIYLARKTGPVVPVDVAPDEPPKQMRWLREKPVQYVPIISEMSKT